MGFLIFSLIPIVLLVVQIQIFNKLRRDVPLNRLQKNIANAYLTNSAMLGKKVYFWVGTAFLAMMTLFAIAGNAWLSMLIFPLYWHFSHRTHRLLDTCGYTPKVGALAVA